MLPDGWKTKKLRDLICAADAGVSVNGEDRPARPGEFGVLKISSVTEGTFHPEKNKTIRSEELHRAAVHPQADRILVSRSNTETLVGASAYVACDYPYLFLPDKLWQLHPDPAFQTHMLWLANWLSFDVTRSSLSKMATGTSGSMKNIGKDQLLSISIPVPPFAEQLRISEILSTWDQAVAVSKQSIDSIRRQSDDLCSVLLSGKRRFGSYASWTLRPVSQMIRESRVIGSGGDVAKKLTVKLYGKGVIGKSDKRAGSESTQYYRRTAGQFIYSKLDFLNGAFGIIPDSLIGYESTLDLPAFDFLPGIDPRWFLHYVSQESFYTGQLGLANGGRKARRVNPNDFLRISIATPCLEEQVRIADAIDVARKSVAVQEAHLALLQREKSALMSQLLTGKRRVQLTKEDTPTQA